MTPRDAAWYTTRMTLRERLCQRLCFPRALPITRDPFIAGPVVVLSGLLIQSYPTLAAAEADAPDVARREGRPAYVLRPVARFEPTPPFPPRDIGPTR